ncbi:MAG: YbaY family lipoprotein [Cyanobacteria bacterium P01_H01_bin.21]
MVVLRNVGYVLLAGITTVIAIGGKPAAAQEENTLVLCETSGTALRVYEKDGAMLMRAFNRQQSQVWMNDAQTAIQASANSIDYMNLAGGSAINLSVDTATGDCAIQIEGQTEQGTILSNDTAASVIGTVTYRERIALQPGSVVKTMLVDLDSDTSIAEQTFVTTEQQVPIPFHLLYSPSDIVPGHRYGMRAEIVVEDEPRWSTVADYPVITQGAPVAVGLLVEMTGDDPVQTDRAAALPDAIATAIKTDLSQELEDVALQVENYSRETWSDGCLGLGGPAELCLAALTEGWRVELTDTAGENYIYRTNIDGTQVRRETAQP